MIPTVLFVGVVAGVILGWFRTGIGAGLVAVVLLGIGWATLLASDPAVLQGLGSFLAAAVLGMVNALPAVFAGRWLGERIPAVRSVR